MSPTFVNAYRRHPRKKGDEASLVLVEVVTLRADMRGDTISSTTQSAFSILQLLFESWRNAANLKQKAAAQAAFKMCKATRLHTASAMLWAPEIVSLVSRFSHCRRKCQNNECHAPASTAARFAYSMLAQSLLLHIEQVMWSMLALFHANMAQSSQLAPPTFPDFSYSFSKLDQGSSHPKKFSHCVRLRCDYWDC